MKMNLKTKTITSMLIALFLASILGVAFNIQSASAECPVSYPMIGPPTWKYEFDYWVNPGWVPDPKPLPGGVVEGFCFDKMTGVVNAWVEGVAAAAGWKVGFVSSTTVVFDGSNVAPGYGPWTGFCIYAPSMIDGTVDWYCDHGAGLGDDNDLLHGPNPPDISKTLSVGEGELGDVVGVTIEVDNPGYMVKVYDTLPPEWGYIAGSFMVNGVPKTPTVYKSVVSYTIIAAGTYEIEFDAKVTKAYWEDCTVVNIAVAVWYDELGYLIGQKEATADFIIHAFEQLHKNVGIPKADVVFAIDLTSSMLEEIDEVKANATSIMNSLAAQIADVQFGLITFMDYNGTYTTIVPGSVPENYTDLYGWALSGDVPYRLDQDITYNTTLMASKIAGLVNGWGADWPQDYSRIIHESYNDTNLHWRIDAKRILILFGDAVPHDTNFDYNNDGTPDNTGGDPGRDTILGTPDDLNFETEVANAAAAEVHIMAVYSGETYYRYPWEYMATQTGGGYFELTQAGQIPEAIKDLIKKQALETLTIKEKTNVQWAVVIDIVNPFEYTMENVVITDRFGAEIEIDLPFPYSNTHGTASYTLHGKSKQVHLTWNIGNLPPGETARLIILVSTDKNPAGKQEYTTPGVYELNSGATLKFIDSEQNMQLSAVTDSIYVTVLP